MAAAIDPWASYQPSPLSAGDDGAAIAPSDTTDLVTAVSAIWVGGAGDLTVVTTKGVTLLFKNVPVGPFSLLKVARVKATGTTATLLTGVI